MCVFDCRLLLTPFLWPVHQEAEKEREGPVQNRLYRSLKLWTFYCDLEESLGTLESTKAVYDRILELRIATPQIILNYALFLQVVPPVLQEISSSASLPSKAHQRCGHI
jgi:pre-mRNA-splicing factor SYF1